MAMLEGLEISIIKKSNLERTNRIDSEFYSKENLKAIDTIKKLNPDPLTNYFKVSDGNHMSISEIFSDEGIPYYRGGDIYNFFIEHTQQPLKIPQEIFDLPTMKRSHLQKGDLLVSIVGAIIGNLSLVKTDQVATCSCKLAILRPANIQPEFAAVFFKSKYGQNQIQKFRRGTGQTGLILEDFDQLLLPVFSEKFRGKIVALVDKSFDAIDLSKQILSKAKQSMVSTLGLQNWKPSEESITVKKYSSSFGETGRLDAEFYQPFYYEIEAILKRKGYALLEDICSEINYGTVPTSPYTEDGTGIPYIKGTNFKDTIIDSEGLDRITNTAELAERFYTKEGDIIISQMGTVGDTGVVEKNQVGWLFASFTIRVRIKDKKNFDPHFVAFYIQHIAKPYYLHRFIAQASVRQNTDLPTIKNLYIPKISIEVQKEISKQIRQSFKLREKSNYLIDIAKQAVEIAVEKDEKSALKFIENTD
ncbi:MAG: restriction endonuclease subunit S [Cyclobacteriaceae bacterium]|jgi:restriction endonuclease S subunit